jgi:hypothetical protein
MSTRCDFIRAMTGEAELASCAAVMASKVLGGLLLLSAP